MGDVLASATGRGGSWWSKASGTRFGERAEYKKAAAVTKLPLPLPLPTRFRDKAARAPPLRSRDAMVAAGRVESALNLGLPGCTGFNFNRRMWTGRETDVMLFTILGFPWPSCELKFRHCVNPCLSYAPPPKHSAHTPNVARAIP